MIIIYNKSINLRIVTNLTIKYKNNNFEIDDLIFFDLIIETINIQIENNSSQNFLSLIIGKDLIISNVKLFRYVDKVIIKNTCPNKIINFYSFQNLEILDFGLYHNYSLDGILPESLLDLQTSHSFNLPVDNLPTKLKIIRFGQGFNQSVNNLPNSLEEIYFGRSFNHPIDNLPNGLVKIKFNYHGIFSQPVNNLPSGLLHITFNISYSNHIDCLPDSIEELYGLEAYNLKINKLPTKLKKYSLCLQNNIDKLLNEYAIKPIQVYNKHY